MVRQFIKELPDSLDETYERVLKGIPKMNQGHVQRLLQCLVVAIRPLRVEELARILAFDVDANEEEVPIDEDMRSEDQEQELLSACPSLITIVDDDDWRVVQFSHFSVQEFLMSDRLRLSSSSEDISRFHILPDDAHTTMAQTSLGVLLHLDTVTNYRNANNTPLAHYAAEHWVSHAQVANPSPPVMRMMETLFDFDGPYFAVWVGLHDIDINVWGMNKINAKPLYYAALCGVYSLVEHLIKKFPGHINDLGGQHDYTLAAALDGRHTRIAELLLRHGANVNGQGIDRSTPLHKEIDCENYPLLGEVQFLLEHGADVNARRDDLQTPLHLAAALVLTWSSWEVALILLQRSRSRH